MESSRRIAGLVLAGGSGRRLGGPKALRALGGISLLDRVLAALRPVVETIRVSARPPQAAELEALGHAVVLDAETRAPAAPGAIAGLLSGFRALAEYDRVVAVAVDLPFLSPKLLSEMARIAAEGPFDAVVPGPPPGFEPLHAVYAPRSFAMAAERAIAAGRFALRAALDDPALAVRFVSRAERARFDPLDRSIFNVNTPEDLERAERWL